MANMKTKEQDRHGAEKVADKPRDIASQAMDKAKQTASSLGQSLSGATATVGQTAASAASKVEHKADDWTAAAGAGLKNLGDTLRQKAPRDGMLGGASQAVASKLSEGGKYLEKEGITGMLKDGAGLIRTHPIPAILLSIGVGFCMGRTLGR